MTCPHPIPRDSTDAIPACSPAEARIVSKFLQSLGPNSEIVGSDGRRMPIPDQTFHALRMMMDAMGEGRTVTVTSPDDIITTQQGAELLGVSRPTFVALIEAGTIPFERAGSGRHRRVKRSDVLVYQSEQRAQRNALLDNMARDAESDGLYDADSADNYTAALREARSSRSR